MTPAAFKKHRSVIGWTQRQAAEALGLTVQQVSHIENARTDVPKAVAILFGMYRLGDTPGDVLDHVKRGRLAAKAAWPTAEPMP